MTVLHLISGRGPTGAAAAAITDILSLRAAGIRACAACRPDAPAISEALKKAGVPEQDIFPKFKFGRGALGMLTALRDASLLSRLVRTESIDFIHAHRAAEHWLALLIPGRSQSAALIRTWHRNPRGEHRPVLSTLAGSTAGCVCVSREDEKLLKDSGAPHARFIHGAVDIDFFQPRQIEARTTPAAIGQAARWKRENGRDRGQRFTLDIFAKLNPTLKWQGRLIGRGELEQEFVQHAYTELKLPQDRVEIVRTQGKAAAEFAQILGALDLGLVFCIGSDGASRPALEMLACGVPLLVSDTSGLRELAEGTSCVSVVRGNDAGEWARAVEATLNKPETLAATRIEARRRAETLHSFKARGVQLADFYKECRKS